jgi:hypothetical protein
VVGKKSLHPTLLQTPAGNFRHQQGDRTLRTSIWLELHHAMIGTERSAALLLWPQSGKAFPWMPLQLHFNHTSFHDTHLPESYSHNSKPWQTLILLNLCLSSAHNRISLASHKPSPWQPCQDDKNPPRAHPAPVLDKYRGKFLRDISNVLSQRFDAILYQGSFRPKAARETIASEVVSKMMLDSSELIELCLRE